MSYGQQLSLWPGKDTGLKINAEALRMSNREDDYSMNKNRKLSKKEYTNRKR